MRKKRNNKPKIVAVFLAALTLFTGVGTYLPESAITVFADTKGSDGKVLYRSDTSAYKYQSITSSYKRISLNGTQTYGPDQKSYSVTYTGSAIKPSVGMQVCRKYLKDSGGHKKKDYVYVQAYEGESKGVSAGEKRDFTVSYSNCTNVGTATVTITGRNTFSGQSVTQNFKIVAKSIASGDISCNLSSAAFTYNGSEIQPGVTVVDNSRGVVLKNGTDYTVSYSSNKNAGTGAVTINGTGNYNGSIVRYFSIGARSASSFSVDEIPSYAYTGSAIIPSVSVSGVGSESLTNGTDYRVTASNNVNIGTATVTITGVRNYTGSINRTFTIEPASIDEASILNLASKTVTGEPITQNPTVVLNGRTLKQGTDYEVSYSDNINVGEATVKVTGKGNYTGTCEATFEIIPKGMKSLTVSNLDAKYLCTDEEIEPNISVFSGETELIRGKDYEVEYSNNIEPGTATIVINGINNYSGSIQKTFKIYKNDITEASVSGVKDRYLYTGDSVEPNVIVTYDGRDLRPEVDYEITYANNENTGTATITITGIKGFEGTITKRFEIYRNSMENATISGVKDSYLYTGSEIEPTIYVSTESKALQEGTDYEVSIANNVETGTATVIVSGINSYEGTITKSFEIYKDPIENAEIYGLDSIYYVENEDETVEPEITLLKNTTVLENGTDYEVTFINNTGVGTAKVVIKGLNGYEGTIQKTFEIKTIESTKTNINTLEIRNLEKTYLYNGGSIEPDPVIVEPDAEEDIELIKDVDYKIEYRNNSDVGTASMTITGLDCYTGSVTKTFKIIKRDMSDTTISGIDSSYLYTGNSIEPKITVKYGSETLKSGEDYEVTFYDNVDTGTATVEINGLRGYEGSVTKTFKIVKRNISDTTISGINDSYLYTGNSIEPIVTVKYGSETLKSGEDYEIEFYNNTDPGTASVKIEGLCGYKGSVTKTFKIVKRNLKSATISGINDSYLYTGNSIEPRITVKNGSETLKSGEDYEVTFYDNVEPGTASVEFTGLNSYEGTVKKTFKIYKYNINDVSVSGVKEKYLYNDESIEPELTLKYKGKYLEEGTDYSIEYKNCDSPGTASIVLNGQGQYEGRRVIKFEITNKIEISSTSISVSDCTYTGKALTPNVVVTHKGNTLTPGSDYTVSYSNNKDVGTATVTITGKGFYKGTATATFKINPKTTSISKVTAKKKSFVAKWKKQNKQTDGYQVQYSLKKNMKSAKIVTIKKNKTTSTTIKKLKAKKMYYVRIRTYKTVNGKKYYSTWSGVKSVKTK